MKIWRIERESKVIVDIPNLRDDMAVHQAATELGCKTLPSFVVGDEVNYIAVFESEDKFDEYMVHMCIQEFSRLFIVADTFCLLELLDKLKTVVYLHSELLEAINDGDED